jgi:hypothetical protein
MTPLACGNPFVGFVPTSFFGARRDGITLGTAMAISGAAVSPNQGYHSSPIVGLLLMLFNVRLGWWLGNPRSGPKFYRREGPLLSILPVLDELAGRATDTGDYTYLSDGGHFDNLGLYEMVRRRCRFILVSDGSDPAGAFEDLGNVVRKIWIDLGVRIEFDRLDVKPRQNPPVDGVYCALGWIRYPEEPEEAGTLIYVKPGFHGSEPPDIRAYQVAGPERAIGGVRPEYRQIGHPVAKLKAAHAITELIDFPDDIIAQHKRRPAAHRLRVEVAPPSRAEEASSGSGGMVSDHGARASGSDPTAQRARLSRTTGGRCMATSGEGFDQARGVSGHP